MSNIVCHDPNCNHCNNRPHDYSTRRCRHECLSRARKPLFRLASSASRAARAVSALSALARAAASDFSAASARDSARSARASARSCAASAARMTDRARARLSSRLTFRSSGASASAGTSTSTRPSLPGWRRHLCRRTSRSADTLLIPRAAANSAKVIHRLSSPATIGGLSVASIAIVCPTASSRGKRSLAARWGGPGQ
jgi:hypothetical protein